MITENPQKRKIEKPLKEKKKNIFIYFNI